MDLGNFRKKSELDEDAWEAWLGEETSKKASKPKQPAKIHTPSQVKSIDGFEPSRVKQVDQVTHKKAKEKSGAATISIQIHMPKFQLPSWRPPKVHLPWQQMKPWLIGVVVIVLVVFGSKMLLSKVTSNKPNTVKTPVVVQAELGYKPVLPEVRAATETQPTKPKYDEKRKLYSFNDTFKGAKITVDQQALPEKLTRKSEVAKLADSLQMTDTFTTTIGEVRMYTSKETGAQRLMVTSSKRLMFIQSTTKLANTDWVEYIQSLE